MSVFTMWTKTKTIHKHEMYSLSGLMGLTVVGDDAVHLNE